MTVQFSGLPCSVTATFSLNSAVGKMAYGGDVHCTGGVGQNRARHRDRVRHRVQRGGGTVNALRPRSQAA